MKTEVIRVDPSRPDGAALARAAEVLRDGGLVAFPTETVYGLGARADRDDTVARIFAAKGRPAYNPLIAHVADLTAARLLSPRWSPLAERLGQRHWPGPLTLVVDRDRARVVDGACAGGPSVAVRVPAHPVALALLRACGVPVAAPSANRFQQLSPTRAEHVLKGLDGRVDLVLDGGPCTEGIESTVVDARGEVPVILRVGALPRREIAGAVLRETADDEGRDALPSPGMLRKHYAPRARLLVVPAGLRDEALAALRDEDPSRAVGLVTRDAVTRGAWHTVTVLEASPSGFARGLFDALHATDDRGCDVIVVDAVPEGDAWEAVRDRLARATA